MSGRKRRTGCKRRRIKFCLRRPEVRLPHRSEKARYVGATAGTAAKKDRPRLCEDISPYRARAYLGLFRDWLSRRAMGLIRLRAPNYPPIVSPLKREPKRICFSSHIFCYLAGTSVFKEGIVRYVALLVLSLLPIFHGAAAHAGNVDKCAHGYLICQQTCDSQNIQCTNTGNDLDFCSAGSISCQNGCEDHKHDCSQQ
jgi:hypothetical protein